MLGSLAVRTILVRADWLAFASLSLGIGGGLLTWLLFLLSWAGVRLTLPMVLLTYGALILALSVGAQRRRKSPPGGDQAEGRLPQQDRSHLWMTWASWATIGILIAAAFCLSVGLSYYTWDDIANWSVKGYGIALEGSILAGARWGSVGLSYPMNLPILIALFRILDGDYLPGSKLLFPLFYASLLVGCYRFWRNRGLGSREASLGSLVLGGTPILFMHATMGYANLAFTFYLSLGVLWLIESMQDNDPRKTLLGSVLLALSMWTRPEGMLMCAGVFIALGLARILSDKSRARLAPLILPPLIVAAAWITFSRLHPTGDAEAYELSGLALRGLLGGDIRWASLAVMVRFIGGQLLRYRDWGFTPGLVGILWIVSLRPRDIRRDSAIATLFFVITVLSLIVFGAHYMAAYSPHGPAWVYEWLSLNFNRVAMPVGTLMTVLAFLAIRGDRLSSAQNKSQDPTLTSSA